MSNNEEIEAHIDQAITDEALRGRIRRLIEQPHPAPWWKRILTSRLFSNIISLVVAFGLTTVAGALLADHLNNQQKEREREFNSQQKERERERSFSDELNKIRVNKIGEVWEKVDLYEAIVIEIMQRIRVSNEGAAPEIVIQGPEYQSLVPKLKQSEHLYAELTQLMYKYKFWLGRTVYDKTKSYADATYIHYLEFRRGSETSQQALKKAEDDRIRARIELHDLREAMLRGSL
jgi:hypothetical protein